MFYISLRYPQAYLEHSRISKMELLAKIVNGFQPLTIFLKSSILDIQLSSEHASDTSHVTLNTGFLPTSSSFQSNINDTCTKKLITSLNLNDVTREELVNPIQASVTLKQKRLNLYDVTRQEQVKPYQVNVTFIQIPINSSALIFNRLVSISV